MQMKYLAPLIIIILCTDIALSQVDYNSQIQPIFNANCAFVGCHGGSNPQQGMNLQSGQSYSNIVNVPSNEVPSLDRIEPFDSDNSYLYLKIIGAPGIVGEQMPRGGTPLPEATTDLIAQWINEGANLTPVGIDASTDGPIGSFELFQNFPNPFNPETTIRYQVARSGNVRLDIFSLNGQMVRQLVNQTDQAAGQYEVSWDGRDAQGREAASGVYFYKLQAGRQLITRKMLLLR
jgi:hypothetical protein